MKNFYKKNSIFMAMYFFHQLAIWSYATLFPMVLSKYYGFSDVSLSYIVTAFLVSFFFGMLFMNVKMEHKIHYSKRLMSVFVLMGSLVSLEAAVVFFGLGEVMFLVVRALEGFVNGMIVVLVMYVVKALLVRQKKNGLLNSVNYMLIYALKGGVPLAVSAFFLFKGYEMAVFIYGAFFYFAAAVFLYLNRHDFTFRYQMILRRSQGKMGKKESFLSSLISMRGFFRTDLKMKMHYVAVLVFSNMNRPFYDLYMVLLLLNHYGLSVVKATGLLSAMVFGQASQVISGYLSDRMTIAGMRLLGIAIYVSGFSTIIFFPQIFENYHLAIIVFYVFGVGRSFYAAYDHKLQMGLIRRGNKINKISFIQQSLAEFTHYMTYLFLGFLLWAGVDMHNMFYFVFFPISAFILIWFFYDRVRLNKRF